MCPGPYSWLYHHSAQPSWAHAQVYALVTVSVPMRGLARVQVQVQVQVLVLVLVLVLVQERGHALACPQDYTLA